MSASQGAALVSASEAALVSASEAEEEEEEGVAEIPKTMFVSVVEYNGAVIESRINRDKSSLTSYNPFNEAGEMTDEKYAEQFLEMLKMKDQFEKADKDIELENMLSRVLFQCLLSGILGFVYNKYMHEFMYFNPTYDEGSARDIAFRVLQSEICTDEQMSQIAPQGITGRSCRIRSDYAGNAKFIDEVTGLLQKENTLTPEFKSMLGVQPPLRQEDIGQNYETLLEMVMRLGTETPVISKSPGIKLRVLKNICNKIVTLLTYANIIKDNYVVPAYEPIKPIVGAVGDIAGNNSTFFSRIKSLVILAAAYNSYGWLFAIIAPFAVPAAANIAIGTLKGTYQVATLPIKLIKYIGTGLGKQTIRTPTIRDPINRLICIGYTTKVLPGDGGVVKFPYYVNLNNILDLSEELQSWQFLKRSWLSTITIGHGVFDLGDWQRCDLPMDQQRLLSVNNPIVTLTNYIDDEIKQLTTFESDDPENIPGIPDLILRILVNTINDDDGKSFAQGPVMQATVRMWGDLLYQGVSGVRSAALSCVKTFISHAVKAGPGRILYNSDDSSDDSSVDSAVSETGTVLSIDGNSLKTNSSINDVSINKPDKLMTVSFNGVRSSSLSRQATPDTSPSLSRQTTPVTAPLLSMSRQNSVDSNISDLSSESTTNSTTITIRFELPQVPAVAPEAAAAAPDEKPVNLFDPELILYSLLLTQRVAEPKEAAAAEEIDGGYRRKHSNMMSHKAAKMQNKLVSQHRTVNNQKVMQYMPEHDINQRKFVKGRKSKNYRNKKLKTKKRNKKQFKKRQTKKVLRKRRTTKKRYAMNKN